MGGYIVNFAIYTMAMLGLIFFALMIYQKASKNGGFGARKNSFLSLEESMSIGPRKNLYVVRAGNERFLLSSDMDKTSFIAKLDGTCNIQSNKPEGPYDLDELYGIEKDSVQEAPAEKVETVVEPEIVQKQESVDDLPVIVDFNEKRKGKKVIKNLLNKINE